MSVSPRTLEALAPVPLLPGLLMLVAGILWLPLSNLWFWLAGWTGSSVCLLNFLFTLFGWPTLWYLTSRLPKPYSIWLLTLSCIPYVQTIGSFILLDQM